MKNLTAILIIGTVLGLAGNLNAAPVLFRVPLDGAQEVPGAGDPDGTGSARLSIEPDALTIDWDITVSNIDFPLTGAHIHVAPAGVAGPIIVDFNSQLQGAGLADPDLAAVLADPTNYYVNVHNQPFPAGAIRGQLGTPIPRRSAWSRSAWRAWGSRDADWDNAPTATRRAGRHEVTDSTRSGRSNRIRRR